MSRDEDVIRIADSGYLAFELSVETKQASPRMNPAFHFGYIPPEEYIK